LSIGERLDKDRHHQTYHGHPDHCFDYLRQILMCNLDMTYESARIDVDGKRRSVDGWGSVHQCKDWTSINAWMLENWQSEARLEDWKKPSLDRPQGQDD